MVEKVGLKSTFVGNPIVYNWVAGNGSKFRAKYQIEPNDKVILLLPGSRLNEIETLLPVFIKSIDEIDITYYWDTISNLLIKFGLKEFVKKIC